MECNGWSLPWWEMCGILHKTLRVAFTAFTGRCNCIIYFTHLHWVLSQNKACLSFNASLLRWCFHFKKIKNKKSIACNCTSCRFFPSTSWLLLHHPNLKSHNPHCHWHNTDLLHIWHCLGQAPGPQCGTHFSVEMKGALFRCSAACS